MLFAYYVRLIAPSDFDFVAAVEGLVTAVVGGSTMFLGPLLGSGFQTMVPEVQRAVGVEAGWIRPFLASLLLLVVILFLPGGLASLIPRRTRMPAAGRGRRRQRPRRAPRHPAAHPAPGETVADAGGPGQGVRRRPRRPGHRPGGPQRRGRRPDRSQRRRQDDAGQHDQRARAAQLGQRHGAGRDGRPHAGAQAWRRPG